MATVAAGGLWSHARVGCAGSSAFSSDPPRAIIPWMAELQALQGWSALELCSPAVRCSTSSSFPSDFQPYRQLHHYNHIILSGIQAAVWEKILVASGA